LAAIIDHYAPQKLELLSENGYKDIINELRADAKAKRDWSTADSIRNDLLEIGIKLLDNKDGTTTWEYKPVQDTQPVG
jgi:cysteinyl-tRNA synthetase